MQEIKQGENVETLVDNAMPKFDCQNDLDVEQAEAFLKDTFNEIPEYEIDDEMYAEIFNCSEDDFLFDIELSDDAQETIDMIREGKWTELSDEAKEDMIQKLSDDIADMLGLEEHPLVAYYEGDRGDCGFYNYDDHTVNLNSVYVDSPRDIISTLSHELRHAFQYQRAEKCENDMDMLYRCNFDNYIAPVPLSDGNYLFFTDYYDQLIETEARAYSKSFMEAI